MSGRLEAFLPKLGSPGRYQVATVVSIIVTYTCMIAINYALNIIVITPKHHCKIPDGQNWTLNQSIPISSEIDDGNIDFSSCYMHIDAANHSKGTQQCTHGYQFKLQKGQSTIATEWELVCDKKYLVRLYQSTHFAGVVVGGILAGYFSDKYGRRIVYMVSLFGQAALMVVIYFIKPFAALMVLSFFRGLFAQALMTVGVVMAMELVTARFRSWVGVAVSSAGAPALALAALCGQFLPNWRLNSMAVIAGSSIPIVLIWSLPESLRWLLMRGKTEDAIKLAKRTSNWNRIKFPKNSALELYDIADKLQKEKPRVGIKAIWDLLNSSKLRNYTCILLVSSIMGQTATYGNVYSLGDLSGDMFTNMYIMSAVDLGTRPFTYIPVTWMGRRISLIISHAIVALTSFLCAVLSHFEETNPIYGQIAVASAIIGKVGIGLFWAAFQLLVNELFPTSARTTVSGTINAVGRLGLFILPQILLLGDYYWKYLPFIVYGVGNLIAALVTFFLPETKDKPMPDTVTTAETMANTVQPADSSSCITLKELPSQNVIAANPAQQCRY